MPRLAILCAACAVVLAAGVPAAQAAGSLDNKRQTRAIAFPYIGAPNSPASSPNP